MRVKDLIAALLKEDPEADVHYMRRVHDRYVDCPPVSDAEEVLLHAVPTTSGVVFALAPDNMGGSKLVVVLLS